MAPRSDQAQGMPAASGSAGAPGENAATRSAAARLSLAAAPTFAAMALLVAVSGGTGVPCSVGHDGFSLSGMVPMYLLMSLFHMAPWLKLAARRRSGVDQRG